jgi:hypothetical protein
MKKNTWITLLVILGVIILAVFLLYRPTEGVSEQTARCIAEHSHLYTQLGCHACEIQEELFGESYKYLNKTDCFFEREKCSDIEATPTWVIDGQAYVGVQSIEKLKELTGCE